jgi:uncharacterized membrane protein
MSVRTSESGQLAVKESLQRRKSNSADHKHPVNVIHHEEATFGEQLADGIASFIGSWRFLIMQTFLVAAWITINSLQVTGQIHLDPYPFILLNLAFSTQAAYAAPLILLAQNRQENRDRVALEEDRRRAEQTKADTEYLARELAALRLAVGEVATRDYLRRELDELRSVMEELRPAKDMSNNETNKPDLAEHRAKRVT